MDIDGLTQVVNLALESKHSKVEEILVLLVVVRF